MKKSNKQLKPVFLGLAMSVLFSWNAYAGLEGWKLEPNGWKYYKDARPLKAWQKINEHWYFFNEDGSLKTGWYLGADQNWYFLDSSKNANEGVLLTGWQWIDGHCYYFEKTDQARMGRMYANAVAEGYRLNAAGRWVDANGAEQYAPGKGIQTNGAGTGTGQASLQTGRESGGSGGGSGSRGHRSGGGSGGGSGSRGHRSGGGSGGGSGSRGGSSGQAQASGQSGSTKEQASTSRETTEHAGRGHGIGDGNQNVPKPNLETPGRVDSQPTEQPNGTPSGRNQNETGDSASPSNAERQQSQDHSGAEGQNPSHGGTEGQNPNHSGAEGQNPNHSGTEGQNPNHSGAEGQNPSHSGAEGQNPSHSGAEGQNPSHNGAEGQDPSHNGAEGQNPSHGGTEEGNRGETGEENHREREEQERKAEAIKEKLTTEENDNVVQYETKSGEIRTILWAKGIQAPTMGEHGDFQEQITNAGSDTYVDYKAPFVSGHSWFDVNKTRAGGNQDVDKNLCFGAVASNMLHWWLEQNRDYVDQYIEKNGDITRANRQLSNLKDSFRNQQSSGIFDLFKGLFGNNDQGFYTDLLLDLFLNGYKPKAGGGTNADVENLTPDTRGGFFYPVFKGKKLTDRTYGGAYRLLSETLTEELGRGGLIGLSYRTFTGGNHIVTLWGAEYDINGKLKAVYISDSDDQDETEPESDLGMKRYEVREVGSKVKISTNQSNKTAGSEVGFLHILYLGQAEWEQYFR